MGEKPCILGEVGIPMDINNKIAFSDDNYSKHVHFLDAVIYAVETNLINFTWVVSIRHSQNHLILTYYLVCGITMFVMIMSMETIGMEKTFLSTR